MTRALDGLRDELEAVGIDEPVGYIWNVQGRAPLLERTAQLRHDIPDIRALWEGDLRVLRQF